MVETAISEIQQGDYLMKMPEDTDRFNMMPHEPSRPVQAKIVSVFEGTRIAGQFQTITIDKGEADGLDKGTVLSLYKRKKTMQVDLSNNFKSRDTVELISTPAEEVGLAMVYRTSEHLSSAIILENISDISVGDTAANPGRDLDNIPDQGRSPREVWLQPLRIINHPTKMPSETPSVSDGIFPSSIKYPFGLFRCF